jgi:hypothetical protein
MPGRACERNLTQASWLSQQGLHRRLLDGVP